MGFQFPTSFLKITADGHTAASDSLEPGERLVNGTTYDEIAANGGQIPLTQPVVRPSNVLTLDTSGVNTILADPEGHLVTRMLPLELRAAELEALDISMAPPAPARVRSHSANDSDPITDATDRPQA